MPSMSQRAMALAFLGTACGGAGLFALWSMTPKDATIGADRSAAIDAPVPAPQPAASQEEAAVASASQPEITVCPKAGAESAAIRAVTDGDTLTLADGREVRLTGIQAPKLALGRKEMTDWPLASESKAALEKIVAGRPVSLAFSGQPRDRNGRILAQIFLSDGTWLQSELVKQGMARVYTWADNRVCGAALLAEETKARAAKKGIWAHEFYNIRNAESLDRDTDSFQIVEAVVKSTAAARGRTYLNFGPDYKTDFTVTVLPANAKRFADANFDLLSLKGKTVRVRGWLKSRNGPEIAANHPEQIEIVK